MGFVTYDDRRLCGQLQGERFRVTYRLQGDLASARALAEAVCREQTVEFPLEAIPQGAILDRVVGRMESLRPADDGGYLACISYAEEIAAGEFTQLLNVLFGNISIMPGIRVEAVKFTPALLSMVRGPRFGTDGLRARLRISRRPPVFTALKPMGLSARELADLAEAFVESGVDIIKDDHGLTDQVFAPFDERVRRCAEAVAEANIRTGRRAMYVPNITGPAEQMLERALRAKQWGAGGVMVAPGLTSLDAMRALAENDEIALPVFSHPAFIGSYSVNPQGISFPVLFGTLMRMAGADAVIFPNYGGRFSLSREQCLGIAEAGRRPLGNLKAVFPSPAGGMQLENIGEIVSSYGPDVLVLIGGGLFTCGSDVRRNCKRFVTAVEQAYDVWERKNAAQKSAAEGA